MYNGILDLGVSMTMYLCLFISSVFPRAHESL